MGKVAEKDNILINQVETNKAIFIAADKMIP